jgi:hypothetical protein
MSLSTNKAVDARTARTGAIVGAGRSSPHGGYMLVFVHLLPRSRLSGQLRIGWWNMKKICVCGNGAGEYVDMILRSIEKQRRKAGRGTSEHRTHNGRSHERKERRERKEHLPSCIMFRRLSRVMYEDSQSGSKSINSECETYTRQKRGRNDRRCDEVGRPWCGGGRYAQPGVSSVCCSCFEHRYRRIWNAYCEIWGYFGYCWYVDCRCRCFKVARGVVDETALERKRCALAPILECTLHCFSFRRLCSGQRRLICVIRIMNKIYY